MVGLSRNQLRIALIIESAGGGTGRNVADLCQNLVAIGHAVHVVYSPLRAELGFHERLRQIGCPTTPVHISRSIGWQDVPATRDVRRSLARSGPFDIVHGHSSKGGALARLAGIRGTSKVVYTAHAFAAMDPLAKQPKRFIYSRIERLLGHLTDAIICVSPEEREFARKMPLAEKKLHMVPNGIESISFPSREEARSELGLFPDELAVGFVGRLSEQKAPEVLLRAFATQYRDIPKARLLMVGDGKLESQLRQLAEQLALGPAVRWLGACDARRVMPAFDVMAIPSRYEGLPYVALEAMAAGLPIVATRAAGCRLLVEHSLNGFLVNVDDEGDLGRRINCLLRDGGMPAAFGAASQERVKQFTVARMVNSTLDVYRHVLQIRDAEGRRTARSSHQHAAV